MTLDGSDKPRNSTGHRRKTVVEMKKMINFPYLCFSHGSRRVANLAVHSIAFVLRVPGPEYYRILEICIFMRIGHIYLIFS